MAKNKDEHAVRIQTSILNPYEKVALLWLAKRIPKKMTSNHLSYIGLFGAALITLGYFLTNYDVAWLWLASLGFVVNWFGDSLDGTIARERHQQRPIYGFFIDHSFDCIAQLFVFGGLGLSCYMHLGTSLIILVFYLALEVSVMMNSHLKNEFKLTYAKFGPTEIRVFAILVNTILFSVEALHTWTLDFQFFVFPLSLTFMDIMGLFMATVMALMYFTNFIKDEKYYAEIDPLIKHE